MVKLVVASLAWLSCLSVLTSAAPTPLLDQYMGSTDRQNGDNYVETPDWDNEDTYTKGGPRHPHNNQPYHNGPHKNGPYNNGPYNNGPHNNGPHHNGPHHNGPHDGPHDPNDPAFPSGFLQPTAEQLRQIQIQAHGSLSNSPAPLPGTLEEDTIDSLRLIAFQEIFEVFYFSTLIEKIKRGGEGFKMEDEDKKNKLLANLKAILAQEELHAINVNLLLDSQDQDRIQPCQYKFPVDNVNDAIALAEKFTDLVLGTLQEVEEALASNDIELIRPVAAVIGQEGEQNGYFRFFNDKIPSELPFLTTATRDWAWSALNQNFIVPGSCQQNNIDSIPYNNFDPLEVDYKSLEESLKPTDVTFSFKLPVGGLPVEYGTDENNLSGLKLVFVNQQNVPVEGDIKDVEIDGTKVTFKARFEYNAGTFGNGLTIAVLVPDETNIINPRDVSAATLFGPALIDIN